MNGARSLIQSLLNAGVEVCFANPGTSEMHLVQAMDASLRSEGFYVCLKAFAQGRPMVMPGSPVNLP
ncbi:thiamine pyrophosphate-binding protein [Pseudomonadales bacterium]|nr:thiamine pyrophosphate-binding protein [Pseudomonadales bacterium]